MRKCIWLGVKFICSGSLIWLVLRDVDFATVFLLGKSAKSTPILIALILLLLHVAIAAWRWALVLNAIDAPLMFRKVLEFSYMSTFFNQVLPSSVGGDVVRVYMAYKSGLRLGQALNSTILDRVASLVSIAVLILLSLPLLFSIIDDFFIRIALVCATMGVLLGFGLLFYLDKLFIALPRWPFVSDLPALISDARKTFLLRRNVFPILGISILGHFNLCVTCYLIAFSLDIPISLDECLLLFPPVLLLSSLPISIAGWGVREGALVVAFGFVGVVDNSAFTLSVIFGLASIVVNLPAGILWSVGGKRFQLRRHISGQTAENRDSQR